MENPLLDKDSTYVAAEKLWVEQLMSDEEKLDERMEKLKTPWATAFDSPNGATYADAKDPKAFVDAIKMNLNLNNLYSVKKTFNQNQNSTFCPIFVQFKIFPMDDYEVVTKLGLKSPSFVNPTPRGSGAQK
jgi:hypothetical protein